MATTKIPDTLVMKAWAKDTWASGLHKSYFEKFTGTGADSIVQIKTELQKGKGDTVTIPLLMPLTGAGVTGDSMLEGHEESLIYKDFGVTITQLRNAVRLEGKFEEQKTQLNMRTDAKNALSDWLATKIDKTIFDVLSKNPSPDRVLYAGGAANDAAIAVTGIFTAEMIGKAKRMATADENTMVKPIKIDGADTYVMVVDQWQARDLMKDKVFLDAQQYAGMRGKENPIFTGALGMYDGVVIHQSNRIFRDKTVNTKTPVSHALFLGAQAAVMAVGNEPEWNEDTFDYKNQMGFAFGRIFGIAKSAFDYTNSGTKTDFGVVNVVTASPDDK